MFDDKVIAVTGAAQGLGLAISEALAGAGARVAMLDSDEEAVRRQADRIGRAIGVACDVTDEQQVAAAARRVREEWGGCSGLVNNAGVFVQSPMEDLDLADWQRVLDVNLTGPFLCIKHFGRLMLDAGTGTIVNVSSVAATCPTPYSGAYSPSKAADVMLARQVAVEWGRRGIRANAVNPGWMQTPVSASVYADPELLAARERMVAVGRIGDPAEVVEVVTFLLSDASSYISGAAIDVDGGLGQMLGALEPVRGASAAS